MLQRFQMELSTGYTSVFVADGRDDAKKIAAEKFQQLVASKDPAVRSDKGRVIRSVKRVRLLPEEPTNKKTFTVAGTVKLPDGNVLRGLWLTRGGVPADAAERFEQYALTLGDVDPVLVAVLAGRAKNVHKFAK